MKKQTIITLAVIVAILAAAIFMGCIEKEASVSTLISNREFRNLSADALHDIAYQLEDVELAIENGDFVTAKIELATFDTSVAGYITKFEEIVVAENTIPSKKALITVFEESRLLGVYIDEYLENPTVDAYVRYNVQAINMTNQVEIAATLAKNI